MSGRNSVSSREGVDPDVEAKMTPGKVFADLEEAVDEVLSELEDLRGRWSEARSRCQDLERSLQGFVQGDLEPGELTRRLRALEGENRDLRGRLEEGRAGLAVVDEVVAHLPGVERLLARIRFLEEQGET